jgi:hypothetical protein
VSGEDFLDFLGEEAHPAHPAPPPSPGNTYEPPEPEQQSGLMDPGEVIRRQLQAWLELAVAARFEAPSPPADAVPMAVHRALADVRARLDQVEMTLASAMALKASTQARARQLEQAADDAWDDRAGAERRIRRDFEGARERYAWWNLDIRPQRQRAREARDLADFVRDVHDRIRLHHDGINEVRRDLAARLTHLRWERNMEQ